MFSGPVETKKDLDKVPAKLRQRYEKLQQNYRPAVISFDDTEEENGAIEMDEEGDEEARSAEQV